jgi:hypothetical protein
MRIRCIILVAATWFAGCAASTEPEGPAAPEVPAGWDDSSLADQGKADALTNWFTVIKGEIGFNEGLGGQTSPNEWFHGYTFELGPGDSVIGKAEGDWYGFFALYGPQKPNGKWGQPQVADWIWWSEPHQQFTTKLDEFTAADAGTYMLVIGSPWDAYYGYYFSLTCTSASCGPVETYCAEWETTDPFGNPEQNFYAVNVQSYEEGEQLIASVGYPTEEQIRQGSCMDQPETHVTIWAPVCASLPGENPATFGNVHDFKDFVRDAAGADDEAKGHWEMGECP